MEILLRRRQLLLLTLCAALPKAFGQRNETVDVEWTFAVDQIEEVRKTVDIKAGQLTRKEPDSISSERTPVVLLIFAGAVAIVALAEALLALRRDARHPDGIVVKVGRDGKLRIESDSKLPPGTIIVQNRDQVTVHTAQQTSEVGDLVKALEVVSSTRVR